MAASSTSDDILDCARSLIIKGGYDGFSYADISKVVGIRNASIHHHFPTKVDLVRTLLARYREDAEAGIAELERNIPDPVGKLRAYTGYWRACIADGSAPFCVCAMLASQLPSLPDEIAMEVRAHFRTLSGWLASVLTQGAYLGQIQLDRTAEAEAELFLATVHGAMLSARAYGDSQPFAIITGALLDRIVVRD
jgi:TetR/AcrR family transcriptional repressor of nem operon